MKTKISVNRDLLENAFYKLLDARMIDCESGTPDKEWSCDLSYVIGRLSVVLQKDSRERRVS